MPNSKMLFIVGAGASSEVLLPTGRNLREKISELLDIRFQHGHSQIHGDFDIADALRIQAKDKKRDFREYVYSCWKIRDGMPQAPSIDNYIDVHKNDKDIELCGKLAIVRSILQAEQNSQLYINTSNTNNKMKFKEIENTWYARLMDLLSANCPKENLLERLKSISLIVFNYDRCIEHFLYQSFQNYYHMSPKEAADFVSQIEIYHPYGVVGALPWQDGISIQFGEDPHAGQLLDLASQIKTFTEGTDPQSSEINNLHKAIATADKIVFLGFAFIKQNMKLMKPNREMFNTKNDTAFFGTVYDVSDNDRGLILDELRHFKEGHSNKVYFSDKKCALLFHDYGRSLSLN